ncbi:MAG: hypothetical protein ACRBF0_24525 [Calditrichia bacterium]
MFKKIQFSAVLTIVLLLVAAIPAAHQYLIDSGEAIVIGFSQEMPTSVVRLFFIALLLFLFFISRTLLSRIVWGASSAIVLLGSFTGLLSSQLNVTSLLTSFIAVGLTGAILAIVEYFSRARNRMGRSIK